MNTIRSMKHRFAIYLLLAASVFSEAQQQPASQSGQAASSPAATQGSQPAPQPQAPPAWHPPQAKSQDEFAAYQNVIQQQDQEAFAKALAEFAGKYPQSELRAPLYQMLTQLSYRANKPDQVLANGRKTVELEPDNPVALALMASALAESTHETDIDHDERLREAIKHAQQVITTLDQSLPRYVPPNSAPEKIQDVKRQLLLLAWDAEGKAEMELKQDAKAQQSLEKALQYGPEEGLTRFRLALVLDRQGRYPEALGVVELAIQNSRNDPALNQQAQQEKSRLQQLTGTASPGAPEPKPPQR
ncbi:MAG: hypothetical protein JO041_10690 [Acidobacteria bacterium]|nr:hypothetical protein [Acidobacteriota bacterium]